MPRVTIMQGASTDAIGLYAPARSLFRKLVAPITNLRRARSDGAAECRTHGCHQSMEGQTAQIKILTR